MSFVYKNKKGQAVHFDFRLDQESEKRLSLTYVGTKKYLMRKFELQRIKSSNDLDYMLYDAVFESDMFKKGMEDAREENEPAHSNDNFYMQGFEIRWIYEELMKRAGIPA